jgi:hypothetical protein
MRRVLKSQDVKSHLPAKKNTVIHSHILLGHGLGGKVHDVLKQQMEMLGVDLVLGKRPVLPEGETGSVLRGRTVYFDGLVSCRG